VLTRGPTCFLGYGQALVYHMKSVNANSVSRRAGSEAGRRFCRTGNAGGSERPNARRNGSRQCKSEPEMPAVSAAESQIKRHEPLDPSVKAYFLGRAAERRAKQRRAPRATFRSAAVAASVMEDNEKLKGERDAFKALADEIRQENAEKRSVPAAPPLNPIEVDVIKMETVFGIHIYNRVSRRSWKRFFLHVCMWIAALFFVFHLASFLSWFDPLSMLNVPGAHAQNCSKSDKPAQVRMPSYCWNDARTSKTECIVDDEPYESFSGEPVFRSERMLRRRVNAMHYVFDENMWFKQWLMDLSVPAFHLCFSLVWLYVWWWLRNYLAENEFKLKPVRRIPSDHRPYMTNDTGRIKYGQEHWVSKVKYVHNGKKVVKELVIDYDLLSHLIAANIMIPGADEKVIWDRLSYVLRNNVTHGVNREDIFRNGQVMPTVQATMIVAMYYYMTSMSRDSVSDFHLPC